MIESNLDSNKRTAVDIVELPKGTVHFETQLYERVRGTLLTAATGGAAVSVSATSFGPRGGSVSASAAPSRPGFIRLPQPLALFPPASESDDQTAVAVAAAGSASATMTTTRVEYAVTDLVGAGGASAGAGALGPTLRAGDVLEFDVWLDRRTSKSSHPRVRARCVRLVAFGAPPAAAVATPVAAATEAVADAAAIVPAASGLAAAASAASRVREQGTVVAVKHGFGFIRCLDRDCKDLYFSLAEVLLLPPATAAAATNADGTPIPTAAAAHLNEGDEVEFEFETDRRGQAVALRVQQLPRGTIVTETVGDEEYEAVVEKTLRSAGHKNASFSRATGEWTDCTGGVATLPDPLAPHKSLRLAFSGTDLHESSRYTCLLVGDRVRVRIATPRRPAQPRRAACVQLIGMVETGRETGVVTAVIQVWVVLLRLNAAEGWKMEVDSDGRTLIATDDKHLFSTHDTFWVEYLL